MNLNPLSLAIVNPRGAGVAAALFEDFTNSAVDFDSSITFTRGSQAMYFDSTGTLKFAPSNMISNNTMVGAVAGTPGTSPTTWNIAVSNAELVRSVVAVGTEDGITYIDVRIAGTVTVARELDIQLTTTTGIAAATAQQWTQSYFLREVGGSQTNIAAIYSQANAYTSASAYVNTPLFLAETVTTAALSTQRKSRTYSLSGGTIAYVTPFIKVITAATGAVDFTLRIGLPQLQMGSEATPAIRTSGSAVYLPRSNAYQDYNPSTLAPLGFLIEQQSTNLLLYSEEFDNAAWTKSAATVTANATTAPTGTVIADKLVESAANSNHSATQAATVSSGAAYTASCFFKAAERTQCGFEIFTGASVYKAIFDLSTGAFISSAGTGTYTIQACQNGWYRITITATTTTTTCNVFVYPASTGTTNYAGNGASGIYVFGAQLE